MALMLLGASDAQAQALHPERACRAVALGDAHCDAQLLYTKSGTLFHPRLNRAKRGLLSPQVQIFTASPENPVSGVAQPPADTPGWLQQAYDLSALSASGGQGVTIGIVDAYADPTAGSDLAQFRSSFGLSACTSASGCFTQVGENGGPARSVPADPVADHLGWQTETSLDLDAVSSVCPNCHIVLVEAHSETYNDFMTAIGTAERLGADEISASWGMPMIKRPAVTPRFSVPLIESSGDDGYDENINLYPASLPNVTAVGGTSLWQSGSPRGFTETAWSGSTSGCNTQVAQPAWQHGACKGRAYPDLSADGDPETGLFVYDSELPGAAQNDGFAVAGGTSLSAPLVAAYEAVTGTISPTAQWAYSSSAQLNDITSGAEANSSWCLGRLTYLCRAQVGYDGPTGVGSISGQLVNGVPAAAAPSQPDGTYASAVTATTATLSAGVYPNGSPTTVWWQYGPTAAYGQQTSPVTLTSTSGLDEAGASLTSLQPSSTYHYRLVMQNQAGTSYGYDNAMTTAAPAAPLLAASPTVSGRLNVGATLQATAGSWSDTGQLSYQWQYGLNGLWRSLPGQTGPAFTIMAPDMGVQVRVEITDTTATGTATAASQPFGPVTTLHKPYAVKAPSITGTRRVGARLRAHPGRWGSQGSVRYQWQSSDGRHGWRAIRHATGTAYRLTAKDGGDRLRVRVTETNRMGAATAYSPLTAPIRTRHR